MSKAIAQHVQAASLESENSTFTTPRERLLEAARELIPEVGWAGVSTRKVAERAGLGSGLVHYHFASLQELLTLAATGAVERFLQEFLAQLKSTSDAQQKVTALTSTLDSFDTTGRSNLLMTETLLAAARHEDVRAGLATMMTGFRADLADWFRSTGEVEDPEGTAVVLSAVFDGLMLHRTIDPTITSAAVLPVLLRIVGKD